MVGNYLCLTQDSKFSGKAPYRPICTGLAADRNEEGKKKKKKKRKRRKRKKKRKRKGTSSHPCPCAVATRGSLVSRRRGRFFSPRGEKRSR
ncbi:hypothetical protein BHM03_00029320 [Ensete ventricosum]|nr:hypothetical protein BHM03_00029320 [Ensete ventricosum]